MGFWADLHVHSTFSDGHHSPEELVHFYGQLGCGAIAITDHYADEVSFFGRWAHRLNRSLTKNNFKDYYAEIDRVAKIAWDTYQMLVLPGFEITRNSLYAKKSSHFLVIGKCQPICPSTDLELALANYKSQGVLLIAAHPLSTGRFEFQTLELWSQRDLLSKYFDAWEVNCAQLYYDEVANSGLPIIASSDLHHKRQINSYKTWMNCEPDFKKITDCIRRQNIQILDWPTLEDQITQSSAEQKINLCRKLHKSLKNIDLLTGNLTVTNH